MSDHNNVWSVTLSVPWLVCLEQVRISVLVWNWIISSCLVMQSDGSFFFSTAILTYFMHVSFEQKRCLCLKCSWGVKAKTRWKVCFELHVLGAVQAACHAVKGTLAYVKYLKSFLNVCIFYLYPFPPPVISYPVVPLYRPNCTETTEGVDVGTKCVNVGSSCIQNIGSLNPRWHDKGWLWKNCGIVSVLLNPTLNLTPVRKARYCFCFYELCCFRLANWMQCDLHKVSHPFKINLVFELKGWI